jgi:hypothetical protein
MDKPARQVLLVQPVSQAKPALLVLLALLGQLVKRAQPALLVLLA